MEGWETVRILFLQRKELGKYRLYFLVYEDIDTVLLVTMSDKKAQQETIEKIKHELDIYKEMIKKRL